MRVLIADDHAVVRQGVRGIVESYDEYAVCCEAGNGLEAVKQTLNFHPDVAILDITMPVMNGIDAAREIHDKEPKVAILMLSMHEYSSQLDALKDIGVKGYVTKSRTADELIQAIQTVARGQTYFPALS